MLMTNFSFLSLLTQGLVCRNQIAFELFADSYNSTKFLHENIRRMAEVDWIESGTFQWHDGATANDVPLSQILTKRGIGFNFNMLDKQDLLKLLK